MTNLRQDTRNVIIHLKVLLLLEKHGEADDRSVDEETTENGHDHGLENDDAAVCQ
jgi:hypothetical protein